MDEYGIKNTSEALKKKLFNYIETAYFGKNDELRELCKTELETQGVMWREPYIEANPAYKSLENGTENPNIPESIRAVLRQMIERKMGVYKNPYMHQIQALVGFYNHHDLILFLLCEG